MPSRVNLNLIAAMQQWLHELIGTSCRSAVIVASNTGGRTSMLSISSDNQYGIYFQRQGATFSNSR